MTARPTKRQLEMLGYVAQGQSIAEIAAALWVSQNTVKTHLKKAYKTLGARSAASAVAAAYEAGLLGGGS